MNTPDLPTTPVPPAASTPAPAAPVKKPILPPQKGFRGFGNPQQDNHKFKPVRSNAVKFIQARRAPGK
ncbi:MAG TPA: hypothetical protein VK737_06380 [Opitutales bacterium]|jgi:hypothetical protein|nr:hypothetical protein [Opitutales bacterium]